MLGLPTLLRPYASAADYARAFDTSPAPLSGGYGRNLASEVARYASVVGDLAARESFDVIHANDWMTFPAGLAARAASGRPLVLHVHASEWDRCGRAGDPVVVEIERRALAEADGIVCVSHYTKRVLERHYGVSPARMQVVHNAVRRREAPRPWQGNEAGAHPAAAWSAALDAGARRKSGVEPQTVLFLGRLTRQKGPEFFLEAAGLVHDARPDVRFLVAGAGDLKASLVESSAANGLARTVFFTGFLAPEEVEAAYASADLYVMPSVSEPFGIAPLEALSLDVPVIVSRQSGVAETLPSAPKVNYWDVRDLAGKVLALLAQPELRRALVASGQRDIESLRWETAGARLVEVLRNVVATQAVGHTRREWWL